MSTLTINKVKKIDKMCVVIIILGGGISTSHMVITLVFVSVSLYLSFICLNVVHLSLVYTEDIFITIDTNGRY